MTVRQYNYSDENHDAEVELAQISYGEDAGEGVPAGEVQSVLPLWRAQLQKVWKESVSDRSCGGEAVGRRCGSGQSGYGGYGRGTDPSVRGYLIRGRVSWTACNTGGCYR